MKTVNPRYILFLSFIIIINGWNARAQQSGSSGFFMMPGIVNNPFAISKGYSASTCYSFQFGDPKFPLKGVVRFGFPRYHQEISSTHNVDYAIKGAYVEPGVLFYFGDIREKETIYYIGLMAYFAQYNHQVTMDVTDPTWGTYSLDYESDVIMPGGLFEFGMIFTLHDRLKGNLSLDIGAARRSDNPIPAIRNFKDDTDFIPGIGHGNSPMLGLNLGLHYVID